MVLRDVQDVTGTALPNGLELRAVDLVGSAAQTQSR